MFSKQVSAFSNVPLNFYNTVLHHVSEDANLHCHIDENLRPHTFCNPITKTGRLMQFREIIDVCYENRMKRLYGCEHENYKLVIREAVCMYVCIYKGLSMKSGPCNLDLQ
jgi:dihydroorotase